MYIKTLLKNKLFEINECIELCKKNKNEIHLKILIERRNQIQSTLFLLKDFTESTQLIINLNEKRT